jgi:hypothetical protein
MKTRFDRAAVPLCGDFEDSRELQVRPLRGERRGRVKAAEVRPFLNVGKLEIVVLVLTHFSDNGEHEPWWKISVTTSLVYNKRLIS